MAEINLLATNTKKTTIGSAIGSLMVKALAVVLLAALTYYGYASFKVGSTDKKITETKAQIESDQQDIISNKARPELLARQTQLDAAEKLIGSHVYWSRFFKDIANATLQTSAYGGFTADQGGTITASVLTADYATLDQWLQVFDLDAFNKNFSDVKVISVAKIEKENFVGLDARINFKYNLGALKGAQAK